MKIVTWNINGIRACKLPLKQVLDSLNSDVICLQETKVTRDQLDEDIVNVENYNAYFSFTKKRSGYSGVATYCRADSAPALAEEGLTGTLSTGTKHKYSVIGCYGDQSSFSVEELQALDAEGRTIITQHQYRDSKGDTRDLVIINVYCPRADPDNEERLGFKLSFYRMLQLRAEALQQAGKSVVIVGDVNASHRRIDHCDPSGKCGHFESHPSRRWLNGFLKDARSPAAQDESTPNSSQDTGADSSAGDEDVGSDDGVILGQDMEENDAPPDRKRFFIDTFRFFYPTRKNAFTCWSTVTGARKTNYGTRIDYVIADENLCVNEFTDCDIMPEFEGSDHCPVKAALQGDCTPADQLHPLCAKLMPEFAGKQQKLSSFFTKLSPSKKFAAVGTQQGAAQGMKRAGQPVAGKLSKKLKTDNKKGSIASFFQKRSQISEPKLKAEPMESQDSSVSVYFSKKSSPEQASQSNDVNLRPCSSNGSENSNSSGENGTTIDDTTSGTTNTSQPQPKAKPQLSAQWKNLLKGLPPPPKCRGHKEPCLLRTVKKAGPNVGKQFYVCCRPEGHRSNPEARCNHFEWVSKKAAAPTQQQAS